MGPPVHMDSHQRYLLQTWGFASSMVLIPKDILAKVGNTITFYWKRNEKGFSFYSLSSEYKGPHEWRIEYRLNRIIQLHNRYFDVLWGIDSHNVLRNNYVIQYIEDNIHLFSCVYIIY